MSPIRLCVHGLTAELCCFVDELTPSLVQFLSSFVEPDWPEGFSPMVGRIRRYEESEVVKSLSPDASAVESNQPLLELYHDGDRYWAVDERWGLVEINLLKRHWRSWVLPHALRDPVRCIDATVIWPMAQLLRGRGLHLVPAVSVGRAGKSWLIIAPFGLERELSLLARRGWRIIGQSWTALRDEDARIEMLHFPGRVERRAGPRLRSEGELNEPALVDLTSEHPDAVQRYGFCDGLLLVEPMRCTTARTRRLDAIEALPALRSAWPIFQMGPTAQPDFCSQLAQRCACHEVVLSRDPRGLFDVLEELLALTARTAHRTQYHWA